jgi:K+-sensing histidine kinase KdpD
MGYIPTYPQWVLIPKSSSFIFIVLILQGLHLHTQDEINQKTRSEYKLKIIQKWIKVEKKQREEQSNFFAMLTHEIKTPLAVIDSTIQTLSIQNITIPTALSIRHKLIETTVSDLNFLVNNTLLSGQAETDNFAPKLTEINTFNAIQLVCNKYEIPTNLLIIKIPSAHLLWVDASLLQIILNNLFINAVKYQVPKTPISITAQQHVKDDIAGTVLIISNRFQSDSPPNTSKWFQKYYRQQEVPDIKGVGLGLYLVKSIVEAHSGHIESNISGASPLWDVSIKIWLPSKTTVQESSV